MLQTNSFNSLSNYADAFADLAKKTKKISIFYEELLTLREAFFAKELFFFFFIRQPFSKQEELFAAFEKAGISKEWIAFLRVIRDDRIFLYLSSIFHELQIRFEKCLGFKRGVVYSSVPLAESEMKKIALKCESKYLKKLKLFNKIDRTLIGGVKLKIGNEIWDSTIKKRLLDISKSLSKIEKE